MDLPDDAAAVTAVGSLMSEILDKRIASKGA
jgi:hypothetical protein